ncbi:MAG: hypothetical protein V7K71_30160 [Nostoc sp.]
MSEEVNDQSKEINQMSERINYHRRRFWALRSARSPHPPIQ